MRGGKSPCLGRIGWGVQGWMKGGMEEPEGVGGAEGGAPDVEAAVRTQTAGSLSSQ